MADESATHKNILAIRDHSMQTRELFRKLETKVSNLENDNKDLKNKLELMQTQMRLLQVKVFSGAATS